MARLDALYQLLEWEKRPPRSATDYLPLGKFRGRPVLPTPHHVAQVTEPTWPGTPASPGKAPRSSDRNQRQGPKPDRGGPGPRGGGSARGPDAVKPAEAKGPMRATVLKGRTRKGKVKVGLADGDPAVVQNEAPDLAEGTVVHVEVVARGKGAGNVTQVRYLGTVDGS